MQMEIVPPQGIPCLAGVFPNNLEKRGITGTKARWQSFCWMENRRSIHCHRWLNHKIEAAVKAGDSEKSLESKTRKRRYPIPMINKKLAKHLCAQAC
jgi:hypothetical protein